MLQFDGNWRFDSPGPIKPSVQEAFRDLVDHICGQGPANDKISPTAIFDLTIPLLDPIFLIVMIAHN